MTSYDVVTVGAGHAGIESSFAAARLGLDSALLTLDLRAIGRMSCNPAVGGVAKGQLVREIDALGGAMGRLIDRAGIQFRMLNTSKGPAVWGPRAQADMDLYSALAADMAAKQPNLTLVEGELLDFERNEDGSFALSLSENREIRCRALVVTTGTFLAALMHTGLKRTPGGRIGERAADSLSKALARHGIALRRLKTGTPMRIRTSSLDFDAMEPQSGDAVPFPFSTSTDFELRNDALCHIVRTSERTHEILRSGFDRSPLFTGVIKGLGPRYCPSIEDKVNRFPDRTSHQLFVEPEGSDCGRSYVNGFSSSLPAEVQEEAMRTLPGFRDAEILRFGYAVEYDSVRATQLTPTLELKAIPGLYFAGQVNGTSGYEEAAAQGLVAGANAGLKLLGREPLILGRAEAYAGVMADDLTTIDIDEPYRMFTSRAEHRLLLRQDNVEARLLPLGVRLGLVGEEQRERFLASRERLAAARTALRATSVAPETINPALEERGEKPISEKCRLFELARRSDPPMDLMLSLAGAPELTLFEKTELWADELYGGFRERQERAVERQERAEKLRIPDDVDYVALKTLSIEARQALSKARPATMGQARRVAGVRATDLAALLYELTRRRDPSARA